MSRAHSYSHSRAHYTFPSLHLRHSSFSNSSVALPTSQHILQSFRCFTYVIVHSATLLSLLLRHKILIYVTWREELIPCYLTYVTAHSPTLPSLYQRHSSFFNSSVALPNHSSFSNPSVDSSTSQLILQLFRRFTYVTAHSPTLPSLCVRYSSFSNSSVALSTSQLILQLFRHFIYAAAHSATLLLLHLRKVHSPTFLSLLLRHKIFTYVTWRAAHVNIYHMYEQLIYKIIIKHVIV